jgi:riboflavin transporter
MNSKVRFLVRGGLLLALAIVFQFVGKNVPQINQFLVGPLINAVLIVAAYYCGTWWGVAIGVLTPVTAFLLGQLNSAMAPFIPFIMLGNAIIVVFFGLLKNYKSWGKYGGVMAGAVLKYAFLALSSTKLIHVLGISFNPKVEKALVNAMGSLQLITALIGGAIALMVIGVVKNKINLEG